MTYRFGDQEITVEAARQADGTLRVTLPTGEVRLVRTRTLPTGDLEVEDGDRIFVVGVARGEGGALYLGWQGESWTVTPSRGRRSAPGQRAGSLSAPMAGVVSSVLVAVGDRVEAYQSVAVIEAMKVLATLEAPFAGTVTGVHANPGARVEQGAVLVELEPSSR